jgi:hypothetical protein
VSAVFDRHHHGRYASRVRVETPQGSAYDGRRGLVIDRVGSVDVPTYIVQLSPTLVLPFGAGEVVVIDERSRYQ